MHRWENDTFIAVYSDPGLLLYIVHGSYDETGHRETEKLVDFLEKTWNSPVILLVHVCAGTPLVTRENVKRWATMMSGSSLQVVVHLTAIAETGLKGGAMRSVTRLFELLNSQNSAKKITHNLFDECQWIADQVRASKIPHTLPVHAADIREWMADVWKAAAVGEI